VFRYRQAGKQRELTLGNYPDMSFKAAQKAARAKRVMVDQSRRGGAEAKGARPMRRGEQF